MRADLHGAYRRSHNLGKSGGNPLAYDSSDACVPLSTQILTRRGWLSHDQVQPGNETLGYNPETSHSEWTVVVAVRRYEDTQIWRVGNKNWHAKVTSTHRWWSDSRFKGRMLNGVRDPDVHRGEFVRTQDLKGHHRLRLAAPAQTDGIPGLSLEECSILGWLMGDGHVRKARGQRVVVPSVRETRGGKRVWISSGKREWTDEDLGWDACIYQSKPGQVSQLRVLLAQVPHAEHIRIRAGNVTPSHDFHLRREYATELLKRARWEPITADPERFVLALSPAQRAAWLTAIIGAEGDRTYGPKPSHKPYVRISQQEGPLLEAIKLAVYLEGFQPAVSSVEYGGGGAVRRGVYEPVARIGMRTPHAAVTGFLLPVVLERQPVWCVTTGLDTWTMRQDGGLPCLTGNSG